MDQGTCRVQDQPQDRQWTQERDIRIQGGGDEPSIRRQGGYAINLRIDTGPRITISGYMGGDNEPGIRGQGEYTINIRIDNEARITISGHKEETMNLGSGDTGDTGSTSG